MRAPRVVSVSAAVLAGALALIGPSLSSGADPASTNHTAAESTPRLLNGPQVYRLPARTRGALSDARYAMVMRFDRDPLGVDSGSETNDGEPVPTRGAFSVGDGDASIAVHRLPRGRSKVCVVAYLYENSPYENYDATASLNRRRLGSAIPVSVQPAIADGKGGVTTGKRAYVRKPRLRKAHSVRFSSSKDQAALRQIHCGKR